MDDQICCLGVQLVIELSRCTPEDYQMIKSVLLSVQRPQPAAYFLQKVFLLAEERRPLLIEMK